MRACEMARASVFCHFGELTWNADSLECFLQVEGGLHVQGKIALRIYSEPVADQNETENMSKPRLIVFDLDYTLWPFWVDCHAHKPFKKDSHGQVYDKLGQKLTYYKDVPAILKKLHSEGYLLGIASRTGDPDGAEQLIGLFGWKQYFAFKQMYPGSKVTHFQRIAEDSGVAPSQMIFFDDEHRNILDIKRLGATCILVEDGVNFQAIEEGFKKFNQLN